MVLCVQAAGKPITLTLSDADFMSMVAGQADAQKMYFAGQLQIDGDMMGCTEYDLSHQDST